MPKTLIEGYRCLRCGHEWVPHSDTEGDPTICPKCKSPYWDKPRQSEIKADKVRGDKIRGDRIKGDKLSGK